MNKKFIVLVSIVTLCFICLADRYKLVVKAQSIYGDVKLVAHRGYCKDAPENTIEAYEDAAELGFRYIEMDVRETSDEKFYMMHDETVDRMTDGIGDIDGFTSEQVEQLRVDVGNGNVEKNIYKVPAVQGALDICEKYQVVPVLHVRNVKHIKELLDICENYSIYRSIIYMVDDPIVAKKIRKINAEALLWGIISDWQNIEQVLYHYSDICNMGFNVNINQIDTDVVEKFMSKGVMLSAWFVNSREDAELMDKMGVEYIVTDYLTNEDLLGVAIGRSEIKCKVRDDLNLDIKTEEYVKINYSVDNTNVAIIENDKIIPQHVGRCKVEVIATNIYTEYYKKYYIEVNVKKGRNKLKIYLKDSKNLKSIKKTRNVYIGAYPEKLVIKDYANSKLKILSSNKKKLLVGSDGTLYPKERGRVKVTIIANKTSDYKKVKRQIWINIIDDGVVRKDDYYYKNGILYKVIDLRNEELWVRIQKIVYRKKCNKARTLRGWKCRVQE